MGGGGGAFPFQMLFFCRLAAGRAVTKAAHLILFNYGALRQIIVRSCSWSWRDLVSRTDGKLTFGGSAGAAGYFHYACFCPPVLMKSESTSAGLLEVLKTRSWLQIFKKMLVITAPKTTPPTGCTAKLLRYPSCAFKVTVGRIFISIIMCLIEHISIFIH